ncbi:hypothetical protein V6U80_19160, partial [Micromonospora sp. CPCC 205543]
MPQREAYPEREDSEAADGDRRPGHVGSGREVEPAGRRQRGHRGQGGDLQRQAHQRVCRGGPQAVRRGRARCGGERAGAGPQPAYPGQGAGRDDQRRPGRQGEPGGGPVGRGR